MRAYGIQRPPTAFSLSSGKKRPREKQDTHLDFVRSLPCLICGAESEAAHLRFGSRQHGKPGSGAGEKSSDRYTVPLCPEHHRLGNESQHVNGNEPKWWARHGIDPIILSALLYQVSGDYEAGILICHNARAVTPVRNGKMEA